MINKIPFGKIPEVKVGYPPEEMKRARQTKTAPKTDYCKDMVALRREGETSREIRHASNKIPHRKDFFAKPLLNEVTCMRPDHFANITGKMPTFREIDGIFGCGQPSLSGVRDFAESSAQEGKKVFWQNLRSEPVIFIKDEPYAVKKRENIRENIKYPKNLSPREVEKLEDKLKAEVEEKLRKGELEIWDQDKNGKTFQTKIPANAVKPGEIKTLTQAYRELEKEYPHLQLVRVPIDDNMRPQDEDYDALVKNFKSADADTRCVVNCQAGKGRTTAAMLVFSMMKSARENPQRPFALISGLRDMFKEEGKGNFGKLRALVSTGKAVDLAVNHAILSRPEDGRDFMKIIDLQGEGSCNFRHVIGMAAKHFPGNSRGFLGTYLYTAAFYRYCQEEGPDNFQKPFSEWVKPHKVKMQTLHKALGDLFIARSKFNRYF